MEHGELKVINLENYRKKESGNKIIKKMKVALGL